MKVNAIIINGPEGCVKPNIRGLFTMFPTAKLPLSTSIPKTFSAADVSAVRTGDSMFVYYGQICYNDAFGAPHFTNYCWMYKGDDLSGKTAEGCLQHNDSN